MAEGKEITATTKCFCGAVYHVRWAKSELTGDMRVYGIPVECPCGVQGEDLEHAARASLDLDARLVLAKRAAELRRQAEEALDLFECEACSRAMLVTPRVEELVAKHGVPVHCDYPMRKVTAQEAAS